jgi:hypothetical protein
MSLQRDFHGAAKIAFLFGLLVYFLQDTDFSMMTLRDRISLTWRYGKGLFLIGAVYNLVCAGFQSGGFSYTFMVDSFILKGVLLPITLYLVKQFRDRDAIFFYINLGLSRRKLLISVILIDFLSLAVLMAIMHLIYG